MSVAMLKECLLLANGYRGRVAAVGAGGYGETAVVRSAVASGRTVVERKQ